mmetsp:Transcript_121171/g.226577  ORF Transcript_121171/g.226577 Transcript_121171/m.226577 type:complete len:248 (-) Transcript_121171:615-1358(-)
MRQNLQDDLDSFYCPCTIKLFRPRPERFNTLAACHLADKAAGMQLRLHPVDTWLQPPVAADTWLRHLHPADTWKVEHLAGTWLLRPADKRLRPAGTCQQGIPLLEACTFAVVVKHSWAVAHMLGSAHTAAAAASAASSASAAAASAAAEAAPASAAFASAPAPRALSGLRTTGSAQEVPDRRTGMWPCCGKRSPARPRRWPNHRCACARRSAAVAAASAVAAGRQLGLASSVAGPLGVEPLVPLAQL